MVREEVDAASRVAAAAEAALEVGCELGGRSGTELPGEANQPREILLAGLLALAEVVGRARKPAAGQRALPHQLGDVASVSQPAKHLTRCLARQERRALERNTGSV